MSMNVAIVRHLSVQSRALVVFWLAVAGAVVGLQPTVCAQHPIEVQRLQVEGKFMESLLEYGRIPKRRVTVDAIVGAGKSAWALGLPQRALQEFEAALAKRGLDSVGRAEVVLSQGIIHFQEGDFEVATIYAERSLSMLSPPHGLRSRALLLWAQALARLGRNAEAEQRYQEAVDESSVGERHNALFGLGTVRLTLGKTKEAREAFELIPAASDHAAEAVRRLAEIELKDRNFQRAYQWLTKGQREHAQFFLDSWVQYALVRCAVAQEDATLVADLKRVANDRFPPSDGWITLLNAEAEAFLWRREQRTPKG